MINTDTQARVDLDVNLDKPVPCQCTSCGAEARWVGVFSCCRHQLLWCDTHHLREVSMASQAARFGGWQHTTCGIGGNKIAWRPL